MSQLSGSASPHVAQVGKELIAATSEERSSYDERDESVATRSLIKVFAVNATFLVLDTWAGRRYYPVELVGQTPTKSRVRILTPGGVMLPGRRYVNCGETVLVPTHAVVTELS